MQEAGLHPLTSSEIHHLFFPICFSWPKHFPSHGPASDERYYRWTSGIAHLRVCSSDPKHCSAWWLSWLLRLPASSWGLGPLRGVRSARDDEVKRSWKGMTVRPCWSSKEAHIPPMAWIHGTEEFGGHQVQRQDRRLWQVGERLGKIIQYMLTQQREERNSWWVWDDS